MKGLFKKPLSTLALVCLVLLTVITGSLQDVRAGEDLSTVGREAGYFEFTAYDRDGNIKWQETTKNGLADEGEQLFLDCVLRATTCPTTFFLRLYNATPTETSTLSTLTGEPSTNGYAAQELTRNSSGWPTLALDSGDYQATSATVTFSASGGSWGPVTYAVLATTSNNTGKHVSYTALSQSRTLAAGESLQVTYKLKLQ